MRKLVLCELFKYRRNKVIPALTSLSLLFPLALVFMTKSDLNGAETLAEYHAYYDSLFNNNLVYSSMLLLPALSGCISAVLFFTERDCGAFKNLRVIPVTERELIFAKLITLYLWSVIYSAGSTAAMTLFCLFLEPAAVYIRAICCRCCCHSCILSRTGSFSSFLRPMTAPFAGCR